MKGLSSILALLMSGCAALSGPDYYKSTPTSTLCRELMTLPPMNVNHPARERELERRGVSCGDPASIARAQTDAAGMYLNAIQATQPARPVQCQTVYNGNIANTACR